MTNYYSILCAALSLVSIKSAQAQAPVLTGITPLANAHTAARNTSVTASFNQPLTTASSSAFKVYSAQRGGLRSRGGTPAMVSGNTLRYTPPISQPWLPGETINYTITKAVTSNGGSLASARVGQFTAAVSNPGGFFFNYSTAGVSDFPNQATLGDIDGDGDLDLIIATGYRMLSVRLNGGTANGLNPAAFAGGYDLFLGPGYELSVPVLGDIDGDGDLDLVIAHHDTNGQISVGLNGGDASGSNTGIFSNISNCGLYPYPIDAVLGDVDGDGDLDLLTTNDDISRLDERCTLNVYLNGNDATGSNTGTFTYASTVSVGAGASAPQLGDIDGDGDLDVVVANRKDATVSICLNGGNATGSNTGVFSKSNLLSVAAQPRQPVLGDVDGDGDLDLVINAASDSRYAEGLVTVWLNGGNATGSNTGIFSNGNGLYLSARPIKTVMGDLDADGDLDLLILNSNGAVSLRLNGGDASGSNTGIFTLADSPGAREVSVSDSPTAFVAGDIDADGDLDLVVTNYKSPGSVHTLLNGGTSLPLALRPTQGATLALYPNPSRTTATLIGNSPYAAVQILDMLGRLILTTKADAVGTTKLATLPAGVYSVCSSGQVLRLLME
jgi:hypothetical protein